MPSVLGRHALAFEDVAEMSAAMIADDLRSPTISVSNAFDGVADLVVEAGPTAPRVELAGRFIQRRVAPSAEIGAGLLAIVQLPGARSLGALVDDDACFFGVEFVVGHGDFGEIELTDE